MPYLRWFSLDMSRKNKKVVVENENESIPFSFVSLDYTNPDTRDMIDKFKNISHEAFVENLKAMKQYHTPSPEVVQFRNETRCISIIYESLFQSFKTDNCRHINVRCVDTITTANILVSGGDAEVQVLFPFEQYFSSSDEEKKKFALEALQQGVERVAKEFMWDLSPFKATYEGILARNYKVEYVYGKPKYSPNRKWIAYIVCTHDVSTFIINLVITDREKREIKRKHIKTEEYPIEPLYKRHLGALKWILKDEVEFTNKLETESWRLKL